jgi:hypothetical protein
MLETARQLFVTAAVCTLLLSNSAQASELEIINGDTPPISVTESEIAQLPQVQFETNTPWTETAMTYEGPTLESFIRKMSMEGKTLKMVALNDYSVEITPERITEDWPIIARRVNGNEISIREKGPYWIMYPFDSNPDLQTESYYALSIWQLSKIEVLD